MKIDKRFNELTISQYKHYIDDYKKYTDFNVLGLYRSICENEKLDLEAKIEIRDYANITFLKTFEFYQLKDPDTYFNLITLGKELTKPDEYQIWENIRTNQERILKDKKIKHRNFGTYSKHNCGIDWCPYDGLMIKKGSKFTESEIHFDSDHKDYGAKKKSEKNKKSRKNIQKIIDDELDLI